MYISLGKGIAAALGHRITQLSFAESELHTEHTTFSSGEMYISLGKGAAASLGHRITQPPFTESELYTEHTTFSNGEIYISLGKGIAASLGHQIPNHRSLKVNCMLNTLATYHQTHPSADLGS